MRLCHGKFLKNTILVQFWLFCVKRRGTVKKKKFMNLHFVNYFHIMVLCKTSRLANAIKTFRSYTKVGKK
jgi:hypothetical protein